MKVRKTKKNLAKLNAQLKPYGGYIRSKDGWVRGAFDFFNLVAISDRDFALAFNSLAPNNRWTNTTMMEHHAHELHGKPVMFSTTDGAHFHVYPPQPRK
jgi:uncharacterized protein with GYD domain